MAKNQYNLIVGNVGEIPYKNKKNAMQNYNDYVLLSKKGKTRAAGESVTLFCNDEIIKEYIGSINA
jgi:hypothetical protein